MKIHVNQVAIDTARYILENAIFDNENGRANSCPVAIACQMAGFPDVCVTPDRVQFSRRPGVKTPVAMRNWIKRFDGEHGNIKNTGEPFSFEYKNGRITNVKETKK